MPTRRHLLCLLVAAVALMALAPAADAWTLDLADSVEIDGGTARLADVAQSSVPDAAAGMMIAAGGRPGAAVTVTSRAILRRLVMAGLADGVVLTGAPRCRIAFVGHAVDTSELTECIRALLMNHLPADDPDAPPAWLTLDVPDVEVRAADSWEVSWPDARPLEPGRNLVTVQLREGSHRRRLSVATELHTYARTAVSATTVPRGQAPGSESMQWIWTDLALTAADPITDPQALTGMRAAHELAPGEVLTRGDLEPAPLVERGELVDLLVRRGGISAVVRAECRQDGLLGETVSVINKFTGRPVVARVTGPGVVSLGR